LDRRSQRVLRRTGSSRESVEINEGAASFDSRKPAPRSRAPVLRVAHDVEGAEDGNHVGCDKRALGSVFPARTLNPTGQSTSGRIENDPSSIRSVYSVENSLDGRHGSMTATLPATNVLYR